MRKRIKKVKRQVDARVVGRAESLVRRLSEKWKLRERIGRANKWADAPRKQTMCMTIGALVFSFVLNVLLTLSVPREDTNIVGSIESVQPMFTGLQHIEDTKDYHLRQVDHLALQGQLIKSELDSLVRLPVKTHQDSMTIITKYRQLEMIVKNLKRQ